MLCPLNFGANYRAQTSSLERSQARGRVNCTRAGKLLVIVVKIEILFQSGRRTSISVERKFIKLNYGKQSVSISAADGGKNCEVERTRTN